MQDKLTRINSNQKTHRHPAAAAKKLPAIGPTAGPSRKPTEYIDMAKPLRWIGIRSEIVPPALFMEQDAEHPCRKRMTTNPGRDGVRAHPSENALKPIFAPL